MAIFYNQATLSNDGIIVNSNTTEAELLAGLEITKTPVTATYRAGDTVVYVVTVNNMGGSAYNNLVLYDNLGAYELPGGGTAIPLDYVEGSLLYYLNGVLQPAPTVEVDDGLRIEGIDLPANSIAIFIYAARANEFAPIAAGSVITNTVSGNGGICAAEGFFSSATVTVEEAPELTIAKAVYPEVLNDNDRLTYTIIVQNLGNTPIVATDGVIISDVFNPPLSDLTVTLNGEELEEGTGYTYNSATGEFETADGAITVPAATYTQDPVTGAYDVTPGTVTLTVSGTI